MEYYSEKYKIKYSDVDRNNNCKLSRVLDLFQDIATSHSDTLGYGSKKMLEDNLGWLVTGWKFNVDEMPKVDEIIEIRTWSRGVKGLTAKRSIEFLNEKEDSIVQVDSNWVLYDLKENKITKPNEERMSKYGVNDRVVIDEIKHTNIKEINGSLISEEIVRIQRRDIDTNGHLNNSRYMDYILESLPSDIYNNLVIGEVEIKYKKQIFENEEIVISTYKEENSLTVVLKNKDSEICAICYMKLK